jgi:hypothetical protein
LQASLLKLDEEIKKSQLIAESLQGTGQKLNLSQE